MRNSSILTVAFLLAFGLTVAAAQVDCEDFTTKDDCGSNRKEHGCRWLRRSEECVHEDIECKRLQHHASCNKFDHCKWNKYRTKCTDPSKAPEAYGVEASACQTQFKERCFDKPKKDYRMQCGKDYKCDYDNRCHARAASFRRRDCRKVKNDDEGDGEEEDKDEIAAKVGDYEGEDEIEYKDGGDVDCDLVKCRNQDDCKEGYKSVLGEDGCCNVCEKDEMEEEYDEDEGPGEEDYDEDEEEEDYDEEDEEEGEEEDGGDYDEEDSDPVLYIREEDIDCALEDCMKPRCTSDEIVVQPDDECCPICVVGGKEDYDEEEDGEDYDEDEEGEEQYDEEEDEDEEDYDEEDSGPLPYLPAEAIDCSAVACMEPKCASDENLETPGGECCPQCAPVGASACLAPDNSKCDGEDEPVTCDGCDYDSPCHAASAGYVDTSSCN